jgi:hypothetical protein
LPSVKSIRDASTVPEGGSPQRRGHWSGNRSPPTQRARSDRIDLRTMFAARVGIAFNPGYHAENGSRAIQRSCFHEPLRFDLRSLLECPAMPRCLRFFVFPRREECAYPQRSVIDEQRWKGEKAAQPGGLERLWAVWLRCSLLTGHCGHARRSRLAILPKPLSRGAAGYFNRLLVNDCLLVELKVSKSCIRRARHSFLAT